MKVALAVLVFVAILITFIVLQARQNGIEERRERLALEGYQRDVHEKEVVIEKAASNTVSIAEQAVAYVPMGSNLVVELLGDRAFPRPGRPQYSQPPRGGAIPSAITRTTEENPGGLMSKEELDRRRGVVTGGGAAPAPVRRADPPPPPPRPPPEPSMEAGRPTEENPAGLMTREQLERRRAGGGQEPAPKPREPVRPVAPPPVVEKPVEPVRPATPPPPVVSVALAKPVGPEEPILIMFRQLQADLATIQETSQKAQEMGANARTFDQYAMASLTSSNAQKYVVAIAPLVDESAKLRVAALSQLEAIGKRYKDMGKEKVRVEAERRAREEAERKRLEEEAQRALVASEIKLGAETHRTVLPSIKKFQFKEALEAAKTIQAQMKTPEGRNTVQPGIDLCTRLVAFKQFLVEQITADPWRWGWGDGGSARDILGATDEGVKHSTGMTPWTDITMKQLTKIIEHYINNDKLGGKVQGEQSLGASLLLRDLDAVESSELYGRRAVQHVPSLEGEITRLK